MSLVTFSAILEIVIVTKKSLNNLATHRMIRLNETKTPSLKG